VSQITLTTLNARYSHTSIGLRYLFANLKDLQNEAAIIEFTINDNVQDIAEKLLAQQPHMIGIGVYIWNVTSLSHAPELNLNTSSIVPTGTFTVCEVALPSSNV